MISKQTLYLSIAVAVLSTGIIVGGATFFIVNKLNANKINKNSIITNTTPTTSVVSTSTNNSAHKTSPIPNKITKPSKLKPTVKPTPTSFVNSHFEIRLQPGWVAKGQPTGVVNITKGDYILYINPRFKQSSGIEGARLDEIITGFPSGDLVTLFRPAVECSNTLDQFENVSGGWKRYSLYTNSSSNSTFCKRPTDGKTHWYFAFYVRGEPYVTYIDNNHQEYGSYVITLSVKRNKVNSLPVKDSTELLTIFEDVNRMLESLKIN